jgi:hypothetical protein
LVAITFTVSSPAGSANWSSNRFPILASGIRLSSPPFTKLSL